MLVCVCGEWGEGSDGEGWREVALGGVGWRGVAWRWVALGGVGWRGHVYMAMYHVV